MIDYTADDIAADTLNAALAVIARERPLSLVLTRHDFGYPDDVRYRLHVKGISVRGVLALEKATAEDAPADQAPAPAARPDLLYVEDES